MSIDEQALERAWKEDGKPMSWQRLLWIVRQAESAKQKQPEVGDAVFKKNDILNTLETSVQNANTLLRHLEVCKNMLRFADGRCWPEVQAAIDANRGVIDSKLQSGGDVCDKCGEKPTKIIGKHIFDTHTKTEESYYCFECNKTPNQRR